MPSSEMTNAPQNIIAVVVLSKPYFRSTLIPRSVSRVHPITAMWIRRLPYAYPDEKSIPRSKITISIPTKAKTTPSVLMRVMFSFKSIRRKTRTNNGVPAHTRAQLGSIENFIPYKYRYWFNATAANPNAAICSQSPRSMFRAPVRSREMRYKPIVAMTLRRSSGLWHQCR